MISQEAIRKRDLAQIKRDLIRNHKYITEQTDEAIRFVEELQDEFSRKTGRRLLARLRRLGKIDEDIMEMMLLPDEEDSEKIIGCGSDGCSGCNINMGEHCRR